MKSLGKFCTYCNRKTRHEPQGEGSICALCGTYSSPSQEEIAARRHRRASEDAIRTIEVSKRVRDSVDSREDEKRFMGKVFAAAVLVCACLIIVIVGTVAWIMSR